MLLEIIQQCNWVDVFIVILLLRIIYIALKNGLPIEMFKLLGVLLAIYISFHYYTLFSDWLGERLPAIQEKSPLEFLDFFVFVVLAIFTYLVFVGVRITFYRFIKMEAVPRLSQFGGLILGILRGVLLVGLIMYALVISSIAYLNGSVHKSYLGRRFFEIAPATYSKLWNSIASKFMTTEKFNNTILEVQEGFRQE